MNASNLLIVDANLTWKSFLEKFRKSATDSLYQSIEYFYILTDSQLDEIYSNPLFWTTAYQMGDTVLDKFNEMELKPVAARSSGSYNFGRPDPQIQDDAYTGMIKELISKYNPEKITRIFIRKPWTKIEEFYIDNKTKKAIDQSKYVFNTAQNYAYPIGQENIKLTIGHTLNNDLKHIRHCQILCGWQNIDPQTLEPTTVVDHSTTTKFNEITDPAKYIGMDDMLEFLALRKKFKQDKKMVNKFTVCSPLNGIVYAECNTFQEAIEEMKKRFQVIKTTIEINGDNPLYKEYLKFGIKKDQTEIGAFVPQTAKNAFGRNTVIIPFKVNGVKLSAAPGMPQPLIQIKVKKTATNKILESTHQDISSGISEWKRLLETIIPYSDYQS